MNFRHSKQIKHLSKNHIFNIGREFGQSLHICQKFTDKILVSLVNHISAIIPLRQLNVRSNQLPRCGKMTVCFTIFNTVSYLCQGFFFFLDHYFDLGCNYSL